MVLALAFPLSWGAFELLKYRKFNFVALLGLVRERICSPRARAHQARPGDRSRSPARRWVGLGVRHRWAAVLLVTGVTALLALPTSRLTTRFRPLQTLQAPKADTRSLARPAPVSATQ